jgi:hypothetical protein
LTVYLEIYKIQAPSTKELKMDDLDKLIAKKLKMREYAKAHYERVKNNTVAQTPGRPANTPEV